MGHQLDNIQPASARDTTMFLPYFQGSKRDLLPLAMALYQGGNLEGQRGIEGGENIPFVATWNVSPLPADLTRCRMQFAGNAELAYEVTITNFEFIGFLMDVMTGYKRSQVADFPKPFYRKLLKLEE
jgi:hypothetical protein